METLKVLLGDHLFQGVVATVLFLCIFGFLGLHVIPQNFNITQIKKILNIASYVPFVIGGLLLLFFLMVFENAMLENPDLRPFNSWIMKAGLGILLGCIFMFLIFSGAEDNLKYESDYKNVDLGVKIVTGFALVVGVFALPGIKLVGQNDNSFDFYAEEYEDVEEEELEAEKKVVQ